MPEATILSEVKTTLQRAPGEPVVVRAITYVMPGQPPRTVWVDDAKYTDLVLRDAIRADQAKLAVQIERKITI